MCCVVVAAFLALAGAFGDGVYGVTPCLAGDTWCAHDEPSAALPGEDSQRLDKVPAARSRLDPARLLAVEPGGLCLLI
jgi:hypothetical protein